MEFSALLCLYHGNKLSEVEEALESAFFEQSVKPSELVVVFDGPVPDDIRAFIEKFEIGNGPVRLVEFPENRGHGEARAAGLLECAYDLVAMIDADDISNANRFEKTVSEFSKNSNLAVVGGGLIEFEEVGGEIRDLSTRVFPRTTAEVRKFMKKRSPVAQPSCVVRRSAVIAVGNYQTWFNNEDYHLWIRLISNGYDIHNVPDIVLRFRTNANMYARRGGLRYWWNEARLQYFSLQSGTTNLPFFLAGVSLRLVIQVLIPNRLRSAVYKHILRTGQ